MWSLCFASCGWRELISSSSWSCSLERLRSMVSHMSMPTYTPFTPQRGTFVCCCLPVVLLLLFTCWVVGVCLHGYVDLWYIVVVYLLCCCLHAYVDLWYIVVVYLLFAWLCRSFVVYLLLFACLCISVVYCCCLLVVCMVM